MNTTIATFVLCFAFLHLLEGIEIAIQTKRNRVYKITHVLYPLSMVGAMVYFLVTGVIK